MIGIRFLIKWVVLLAVLAGVVYTGTHYSYHFATDRQAMGVTTVEAGMWPRIVEKRVRRIEELSIGDLILFRVADAKDDVYLSRVVGLPGDMVALDNGEVMLNGGPLDQSEFVGRGKPGKTVSFPEMLVPRGHVFVLNDVRAHADGGDSRALGPIVEDLIIARLRSR